MNFPLRYKLTLVYGSLFLLSASVLEIGTYWAVSSALDSVLERELVARRAVVEEYVDNHVLRLTWPDLRVSLAAHRGFQTEWLAIEDNEGNSLFSGPRLRQALADPNSGPARVLREVRRIRGKNYVFITGMDANIPAEVLHSIRNLMLLSAPLLLLLASGVGYWIAGRALRPVKRISEEAHSIDANNLATRLAVPRTRDEIQLLAETINHMLDRIESGFRQVSQFTANASHELRTPVAIIRSTAEVALLHPAAAETPERHALRRILRQSERSSQLLDDMLRLARLDAGTDVIRRQPIDLKMNMQDALSAFFAPGQPAPLSITWNTPASPAFIEGDESHLRRLWTILFDNALKYSAPGGRLEIHIHAEPSGPVVCSVHDSGCGIPTEDLPNIFERFYRADKSRTSNAASPGGFGLGLSLARQICEAHGTTIHAESTPGLGSTFSVTFPKTASLPLTPISGNSQVYDIALK